MSNRALLKDPSRQEWVEHPRFPGIDIKTLLTSGDNPFASAGLVRVHPQGIIGRHKHAEQLETVYVLAGSSVLVLGNEQFHFIQGQMISIPAGLEHSLFNEEDEPVDLLTFFTPPVI
jgi:quercetin dioxygenase-like cupin family protein